MTRRRIAARLVTVTTGLALICYWIAAGNGTILPALLGLVGVAIISATLFVAAVTPPPGSLERSRCQHSHREDLR